MTTTTTHRAYKFRFYPTEEQENLFSRTFGCVRLVYNKSLHTSTTMWRKDKKSVASFSQMSKLLTEWKRDDEFTFLNEVSSVALQQSQRNLVRAFQNFWKKNAGYPRFKKKKKSRDSFTLVKSAFSFRDNQLFVAKSKDPLNIVWSRKIPEDSQPSSVTVSRNRDGRWFVSILVEEKINHLPPTGESVGLDMGLTDFVVDSRGVKTKHPRMTSQEKIKRSRLSRSLSRKQKGSANREKARKKLARFDQKMKNRRTDFLHKLSTQIVRDNDIIAIEDLNVQAMMSRGGSYKKGLNRSIGEASWGEFRSMLEYKSHWYGRDCVVIDRWFPSSQICSHCGHIDGRKELSIRKWQCPHCGTTHDRDINAAKNILAAGQVVSACGDNVKGKTVESSPVVVEAGIPRL